MARDSSGTFTSVSNSWNAAVEGTTIDEGDWNEWRADVETELTDSVSRSGKGTISAHIDLDENGSPGTPASNVGRLYAGDVGGITSLFYRDSAGTTHDLTLPGDGVPYTFASTTTTTSDPGANKIAFNNATFASITEIAIDDLDAHGADISAWIATWDDEGTTNRGNLILRNRANGGNVAIFRISGANTDETGWTRLAVTPITQAGAFSDLDPLFVHYGSPGAQGPTGATGDTGAAGADGADGASNIFVQASEPAGNDGDLWIDTDDGALYKKISGTWTSQSYSVVGPTGATGATGAAGADGAGVAAGGTTGQALRKASDTDFDTEWYTPAGGGDALTANPLSQFAATTSDQLRGVISDETGTGALVFATSPTFVTPALGTPASGTLTNCTGYPASTDSVAGVVEKATDAEVRSRAADKNLTTDLLETAAASVAITSTSNVMALDWQAGFTRTITLDENTTLQNPTNPVVNSWVEIIITQGSTGGTLSFASNYKFMGGSGNAPTLSSGVGKVDTISIRCISSTVFYVYGGADWS